MCHVQAMQCMPFAVTDATPCSHIICIKYIEVKKCEYGKGFFAFAVASLKLCPT